MEDAKMTDIDKIVSAIVEKAKADAEATLSAAEKYAEECVARANADATAYREERLAAAKAECESIVSKRAVNARMDAKQNLLDAKVGLISEVYARTKAKLCEMKKSDYQKTVDGLIAKYAVGGEVVLLPKDGKLSVKEAEELSSVKKLGLSVKVDENLTDGFVLSGKNFDRDMSFDAIIKSLREETEGEIADRLFCE